MQIVGGWVPDHLINTDQLTWRIIAIPSVPAPKAKQKHCVDGHGGGIDGPVKGNGKPRLGIESIKGIEDTYIRTLRCLRGAVRCRKIDANAGQLPLVCHGEPVAGKRALVLNVDIKQGMNVLG